MTEVLTNVDSIQNKSFEIRQKKLCLDLLTVPVIPSATVYCCGVNANPSCGPAGVVGLSEKGQA